MNSNLVYKVIRGILILFVVSALLTTVTQVVYAILYDIDTTDSSIAEWGPPPPPGQDIQVYQTDPTGESGVTPNVDIHTTWIASGPSTAQEADWIYFLVELGNNPPLGENLAVGAVFDCTNDVAGNNPDPAYDDVEDRIIAYVPQCCHPTFGCSEQIAIVKGDQSGFYTISGGASQGQLVGQYAEWGVLRSELPPDPGGDQENCRNAVENVIFYTVDVTSMCTGGTDPGVIQDQTAPGDTTPWKGWNIPTAVELRGIEAYSPVVNGLPTVFVIIFGALSGFGLVALVWWRRK